MSLAKKLIKKEIERMERGVKRIDKTLKCWAKLESKEANNVIERNLSVQKLIKKDITELKKDLKKL